MTTYIIMVLACLTAMALVGYGKEVRCRIRRREPIIRRKHDKYWDSNDNY
jgi:hypothetical protein